MSSHDEHEDEHEEDVAVDDEEQQDEQAKSFKDEAESAPVTINEWVELEEDEEDDDEFNPDEAAEDEEEDGDEDEEDEDEEIDEDEEKALQEDEAQAEQEADAELQGTAAAASGDAQDDDGEDEDEEGDGEGDGESDDEDDDEEEGDVSVFESGAGMMSGAAMNSFVGSVMKADGPTVATVLLKADGTKEELMLDMTPRIDSAGRTLGGKTSFLGQYPALDVVILTRRDNESNEQLPLNQHSLPQPFDGDKVRGDILLVRMDARSEPQSLTLAEWQQFCDAGGNVAANGSKGGQERMDGEEEEEADAGVSSSSGAARKKQRKV